MTSSSIRFTPKITGFLCNWCAYAGADMAGAGQLSYPPNMQVIRVMCSGRVDPQFILQAFRGGADGVMIMACHPGDCHYKEGNCRALQRQRLLLRVLHTFGIGPERCRLEYVSASEGARFQKLVTDMICTVRALGPLKVVPATLLPQ